MSLKRPEGRFLEDQQEANGSLLRLHDFVLSDGFRNLGFIFARSQVGLLEERLFGRNLGYS